MSTGQEHWEKVYTTKQPHEVSWTQAVPTTSLQLLHTLSLPADAAIIDVGGGDSQLVDHLLAEGYNNLTVLDISAAALDRAKARLGDKAIQVNWVVQDITAFRPTTIYDVWHDRAAFHFLTTEEQIHTYLDLLRHHVKKGGYLLMGTFSENGPSICSGLPVQRYSAARLAELLQEDFDAIQFTTEDHTTPFNTTQNFLFGVFRRKSF